MTATRSNPDAGSPVIIGVRHHSPACARLVRARIEQLRPAHVLVEGPADFNDRLEELALAHRLPIAIYSYLSTIDRQQGSWSPLAEHSPEWQAISAGREQGANVRFIDLPAWHDAFADVSHRYADQADEAERARAAEYTAAVSARLGVEGSDALWDHLFESVGGDPGASDVTLDELQRRLDTWFEALRGDAAGSPGNRAREAYMARWIGWAMARSDGPVLVVCGGYHAPALERAWPDAGADEPSVPQPNAPEATDSDLRHGSYLVPYSFHRLDSFTGYASGMPSPGWYQWLWEDGAALAGEHLLRRVRDRLRGRKLPVSTATLVALHTHVQALSRLRGNPVPSRSDWLDSMAATLVDRALDVPVPWSYRGTLRPGTDPVLVEVMAAASGDTVGELAGGTPQPPLVGDVAAELAAHGLPVRGEVTLDLTDPADRSRSRVLHRLALLDIPGVRRESGPARAIRTDRDDQQEGWRLSDPVTRLPALIEAGAWGGTLAEAARARWARLLSEAESVAELADALERAAVAGLGVVARPVLSLLTERIAGEQDLDDLGAALAVLLPLARHADLLDLSDLPAVVSAVGAIVDRALWLLEPPLDIGPAGLTGHLRLVTALRDVVRSVRAEPDVLVGQPIGPSRVIAVLERKARSVRSAPVSRGAALGALISLAGDEPAPDPLPVLSSVDAAGLGDALAGLLALAREELISDPDFVAGLDSLVVALPRDGFVGALPALRGAFSWLPPRERGQLAEAVLARHGGHGSARSLTAPMRHRPQQVAHAADTERKLLAVLERWGVVATEDDDG